MCKNCKDCEHAIIDYFEGQIECYCLFYDHVHYGERKLEEQARNCWQYKDRYKENVK